jgi:pyridoxamine 5'-phosphate oxidase
MGQGDEAADRMRMAAMRAEYSLAGLTEGDLAADWVGQFDRWLHDAIVAGLPEPNAMVLATATPTGEVASRTVLCKGVDASGVVFYTNLGSDKSRDLTANPRAAVTFPWIGLQRQVHVRGPVERVSDELTQQYWATRPRGSRLGAWASPQSSVLPDREALERLQAEVVERFGGPADTADTEARPVPLPDFWGGWRIVPESVEFWQGRHARLHDRLRYRRSDRGWVIERLAP